MITCKREHLMSSFSSKPFLCFGVFSEILRTFWPKIGWVGVTVDTFSENGTVLSYKLTEGNHIGDGNIWEFCLTDAHFNKFHSAS